MRDRPASLMGPCSCVQAHRPQTNVKLVMETLLDLSALFLFVCLLEKFEWEFATRLGPRLCGEEKNLETSSGLIINLSKLKKNKKTLLFHLSTVKARHWKEKLALSCNVFLSKWCHNKTNIQKNGEIQCCVFHYWLNEHWVTKRTQTWHHDGANIFFCPPVSGCCCFCDTSHCPSVSEQSLDWLENICGKKKFWLAAW